MDEYTFYQDLWFQGVKRPKSVPSVYRVEVQMPLPGHRVWRYSAWYWWEQQAHRVTAEVDEGADWKKDLAAELMRDFLRKYPEDARKAIDTGSIGT